MTLLLPPPEFKQDFTERTNSFRRNKLQAKRSGRRWTDEDLAILRDLRGKMKHAEIAKILGRTEHSVESRAVVADLAPLKKRPTASRYRALLEECAAKFNVHIKDVLSRSQYRPAVDARNMTWLKLAEEGCGYSGIAMVAGYHHTSISHGVKRAQKLAVAA